MFSDQVKEAASLIGHFYLQKNNGDYAATEIEIRRLNITNVEVVTKDSNGTLTREVIITTSRPGLLIGKRGSTIDALTKHMGVKVKIIENADPLESYLIPYQPEPMDYLSYEPEPPLPPPYDDPLYDERDERW